MSAPLDAERWERIATVFDRARSVSGDERAALLDAMCGSDRTVRGEVEAMLSAHERGTLLTERRVAAESLATGALVGPYRIVSPIGSGGMGDVYRAERVDHMYRQSVALKVLRPGHGTAELVRRFRIEREALARLAHPGIARILDGGVLDDGRPYIVLELVDGEPITAYCESRSLGMRERLALFVRVAEVVQFAHGRLVVHRDIKPSNILVTDDGAPRLLDFGIAKLLDVDDDTSLRLETAPDVRLLTPEYAAPEQIRGEPPTTATDVYALGVLLFELLAGARPFRGGRGSAALEQAILHEPAPSPSAVAGPRVARTLRGDLDRIVLMALRKEPDRRYVSAAQFAEDVERWLAGRPVHARPDSVRYRVAKFVGRNRALVVAGAALAALLVAFGVTATVQARRVARERDRAERERVAAEDVLGILTGLFERGNPATHPGGDTLRVTSLLDDAERAVDSLRDDPARRAATWRAVARMRAARGEYARAIDLLGRARAARLAQYGPDDADAARMRHDIATITVAYRGETAAHPLLDSSLTELRRLLGEEHEDVRAATSDLLAATSDSVAARALLARLTDLERRAPSRDPVALANQLNARGSQRFGAKRYDEAAALFEASRDLLRRVRPPTDDDARTVQRNLAAALSAGGHYARAESLQRADVALEDRLRGGADTRAITREALALTLVAEGRADSAEAREREALRLFRAGLAPGHWRVWSAQRNLAFIVRGRGRDAEGLALLDSAIALAAAGPDSVLSGGYLLAQRAPLLLSLGRTDDAARTLAAAERRLGASPAVTREHRADVERYGGMVLLARGDAASAASRFRAAVALHETPGESALSGIDGCLLGVALAAHGDTARARPLLATACRTYASRGMPDPLVLRWAARARATAAR